jgi:hypothetical protein
MIIHSQQSRSRRLGIPGFAPGDRWPSLLAGRLDDAYHYLRNVAPAGMPLIHAVVVGPGGTWTLRFGDERGGFRKRNGHWYRWNGSTESWVPWEADSVTEARLSGHRLLLYLERAGLQVPVEACLVVSSAAQVSWEPDQRPGVHIQHDPTELATRIGRDEVLSQSQVDRIVALLDPRQPVRQLAPSTQG